MSAADDITKKFFETVAKAYPTQREDILAILCAAARADARQLKMIRQFAETMTKDRKEGQR